MLLEQKATRYWTRLRFMVCVTTWSLFEKAAHYLQDWTWTPHSCFFKRSRFLHLCQQEVPLKTGDDCQMKCSLPPPWHWIEWIISARFTEGEAGVFLPAAHRSPPGSDSTAAAAGEKTGFGRTGSSLSQNDSAFFFLQGEASDVTIQKEEVNPSCDIVMASSGGSHGWRGEFTVTRERLLRRAAAWTGARCVTLSGRRTAIGFSSQGHDRQTHPVWSGGESRAERIYLSCLSAFLAETSQPELCCCFEGG